MGKVSLPDAPLRVYTIRDLKAVLQYVDIKITWTGNGPGGRQYVIQHRLAAGRIKAVTPVTIS